MVHLQDLAQEWRPQHLGGTRVHRAVLPDAILVSGVSEERITILDFGFTIGTRLRQGYGG